MIISTKVKQEPGILSCLADKYGHPYWERPLESRSIDSLRVSPAPRADKYGHLLESTSRRQEPGSRVSSRE